MSEIAQAPAVDDLVAEGELRFRSRTGGVGRVLVRVGRPRHLSEIPEDDWFCPVWMEGGTPEEVRCFGGGGPVDSLMAALEWVRSRTQELEAGR